MAYSSSSNSNVSVEKLIGRDNYNSWKFAMQALLELEDLWGCITGDENYMNDAKKVTRARSKIILLVEPLNYVHIQETKTAKEAWDNLQSAFEDSGLTRKVGLLRKLVTTQLNNCSSVEDYVNTIITTAHKLNGLSFNVNEEWIGTLLLAGLPEQYSPMIMGLESSGTPITGDSIKTKLLQDIRINKEAKDGSSESALFFKNVVKKKFNKDKVRCYSCNRTGHFASECRSKKNDKSYKNEESRKDYKGDSKLKHKAFYALFTSNVVNNSSDWFIDSCASSHMTVNENWFVDKKPCIPTEIMAANSSLL